MPKKTMTKHLFVMASRKDEGVFYFPDKEIPGRLVFPRLIGAHINTDYENAREVFIGLLNSHKLLVARPEEITPGYDAFCQLDPRHVWEKSVIGGKTRLVRVYPVVVTLDMCTLRGYPYVNPMHKHPLAEKLALRAEEIPMLAKAA